MPLQELQDKTTSSEFVEWLAFLDLDVNGFHREDYYMAQIAAEVRRTIAKEPRSVRVDDFVLSFRQSDGPPKEPATPEEHAARMAQSKAAWASYLSRLKE